MPFCNQIILSVEPVGSTFQVSGWDDNCLAVGRDPIIGTMFLNGPDVFGSLLVMTVSGPQQLDVLINQFTLSGAWKDTHGGIGTFLKLNP